MADYFARMITQAFESGTEIRPDLGSKFAPGPELLEEAPPDPLGNLSWGTQERSDDRGSANVEMNRQNTPDETPHFRQPAGAESEPNETPLGQELTKTTSTSLSQSENGLSAERSVPPRVSEGEPVQNSSPSQIGVDYEVPVTPTPTATQSEVTRAVIQRRAETESGIDNSATTTSVFAAQIPATSGEIAQRRTESDSPAKPVYDASDQAKIKDVAANVDNADSIRTVTETLIDTASFAPVQTEVREPVIQKKVDPTSMTASSYSDSQFGATDQRPSEAGDDNTGTEFPLATPLPNVAQPELEFGTTIERTEASPRADSRDEDSARLTLGETSEAFQTSKRNAENTNHTSPEPIVHSSSSTAAPETIDHTARGVETEVLSTSKEDPDSRTIQSSAHKETLVSSQPGREMDDLVIQRLENTTWVESSMRSGAEGSSQETNGHDEAWSELPSTEQSVQNEVASASAQVLLQEGASAERTNVSSEHGSTDLAAELETGNDNPPTRSPLIEDTVASNERLVISGSPAVYETQDNTDSSPKARDTRRTSAAAEVTARKHPQAPVDSPSSNHTYTSRHGAEAQIPGNNSELPSIHVKPSSGGRQRTPQKQVIQKLVDSQQDPAPISDPNPAVSAPMPTPLSANSATPPQSDQTYRETGQSVLAEKSTAETLFPTLQPECLPDQTVTRRSDMPSSRRSVHAAEYSPPDVRITIGRIKVEAPGTEPPTHKPGRPKPSLSIQNYLERRRRTRQ